MLGLFECLHETSHSDKLEPLRTLTEKKFTGVQQWLLKNISVTKNNSLMDAHEISVQSAVMSGLEDVNSSQFFTRSNINNLRGHSLKEHLIIIKRIFIAPNLQKL